MAWFVLCTKPRSEKKVTTELQKLGVVVFYPFTIQVRQWSDRKKKIEVPLINSCVFVQLENKQRELVFQVPGVVRYLFWLGKPAVVKNEEIETLKQYLQDDIVEVVEEDLQAGDKMTIKKGAFKGKEGIIKEVAKNRIQLLLVSLGMKITLTRQK